MTRLESIAALRGRRAEHTVPFVSAGPPTASERPHRRDRRGVAWPRRRAERWPFGPKRKFIDPALCSHEGTDGGNANWLGAQPSSPIFLAASWVGRRPA